ncbi:MAG: NAD(P)-dependent alcohol dehydrogenase, partial [Streptomycetaceae bacterium]|nr:NAD(P)-dependent alcohol dehydrogenase [Streptomycetaceae bacterium]
MKAVQYVEVGAAPVVVDIPKPTPGPGQVLLKVTAAGVCHSDIAVMSWTAEQLPFPLPLTLGHEGAGIVAEVGDGVRAVKAGDAVAVYGPWGCGMCLECAQGKENYCLRADELGIRPPGLGAPGAIAEYLLVDHERHLVPLDGLDPVETVPLTDAGLTPYHAIKKSLPKLLPGSTAVVIGTGGLGHVGIQLLRAMTAARVIALDVTEDKLALAREVGAHDTVISDADAAKKIRDMTGGLGAEVVLDFVGAPPTVATAGASVRVEGDVTIVGLGGGTLAVGFGALPYEVSVMSPYWGSRSELIEVLDLARAGSVKVHVETYGIDEAPKA